MEQSLPTQWLVCMTLALTLQVLLLDEPMVGLDPCSRHHVWELLAERRAGRVTLICTQSVEEADACAGEPRCSLCSVEIGDSLSCPGGSALLSALLFGFCPVATTKSCS